MTHSPVRTSAVLVFAAVALCVAGAVVEAGPINPPAGPVAPTPGPEPRIAINAANTAGDTNSLFRIAQPGSYYLTGNVTGEAAKYGIEIAASGVTIDLNGFDLLGVAGSLDGIAATGGNQRNITIRNGSVRNWGGDGIDLFTTTNLSRVEGVHSSGNVGDGIRPGDGGLVVNCNASYNGDDGITSSLTVIGCVARNNTGNGILILNGGSVTDSSAFDNTGHGIYAGNGCNVTNCTSRDNGDGIIAFGDSLIKDCSTVSNTGYGINGQQGTTIIDCIASENGSDGIIVLSQSLVRGNTCTGNTSDGIFVSSSGENRIEGNHMAGNGRGLHVIGPGNVIMKNTASGNTIINWLIAADNVVAPIIDRTAVVSAAINGNSAPSSTGTADETANFTH
ncbi:MAG: right-handed parallel beta-helix repeat-containing protein [Phycisphaerales bacterium]